MSSATEPTHLPGMEISAAVDLILQTFPKEVTFKARRRGRAVVLCHWHFQMSYVGVALGL